MFLKGTTKIKFPVAKILQRPEREYRNFLIYLKRKVAERKGFLMKRDPMYLAFSISLHKAPQSISMTSESK